MGIGRRHRHNHRAVKRLHARNGLVARGTQHAGIHRHRIGRDADTRTRPHRQCATRATRQTVASDSTSHLIHCDGTVLDHVGRDGVIRQRTAGNVLPAGNRVATEHNTIINLERAHMVCPQSVLNGQYRRPCRPHTCKRYNLPYPLHAASCFLLFTRFLPIIDEPDKARMFQAY